MQLRKIALAALAVVAFGGQMADAKSCRDAKGKFTKCEAPKKAKPCRDKAGKFAKCGAADATAPAPAANGH